MTGRSVQGLACELRYGTREHGRLIVEPRVTELHCIMPMANIGSVMAHGILSYERAARLAHHSVALQQVAERDGLSLESWRLPGTDPIGRARACDQPTPNLAISRVALPRS